MLAYASHYGLLMFSSRSHLYASMFSQQMLHKVLLRAGRAGGALAS